MGKRLTSLLLGVLAAGLLATPALAQPVGIKAMKKSALSQKLDPKRADLRAKALDARTPGDYNVARDGKTRIPVLESKLFNTNEKTLNVNGFSTRKVEKAPVRKTAANRVGEVVDANGIITAPAEGEQKYYSREGYCYYLSGYSVAIGVQSGYAEIVECEDGTVYMHNPVSRYTENDAWVKGTKSGDVITIPAKQPVAFSESYMTTLSLRWGSITAEGKIVATDQEDNFIFNIEGDKLVLQGTKGYAEQEDCPFMGIFWDDDDSSTGYGDAETVLTYTPGYKPYSTTLVQIPTGLQYDRYTLQAVFYKGGDFVTLQYSVNLGFDGNDVYLQGLFGNFKTAWIKGTLDDEGYIAFESMQYLGQWYDSNYNLYDSWMTGLYYDDATGSYYVTDLWMYYDKAENSLYALTNALCVIDPTTLSYLEWLVQGQIVPWIEPVAETGAPVDNLPYIIGFSDDAQVAEFGIIDANEDAKTWDAYNEAMRYSYHSTNDADDWLVSPAILLEEGKEYAFSIDARANSNNFPERVEVKMGTEAKASAMTKTVIEKTDLVDNTYVTLENNSVTVSKTGYYYFGIHAISDADQYYLFVDNFSLMAPVTEFSPRAPMVQVQPNPYGGQRAVITVTAPELCMNGDAIDANLQKVVLYRDGAAVKVFNDVTPGDILVFSDTEVANGKHVYMALPFDAKGVNGMKSDRVSAVIGLDTPDVPVIKSVVAANNQMTVSWNPVTTGENGGMINTEDIEYSIYTVAYEEFYGYLFPYADEEIGTTKGTSITLDIDTESGDTRLEDFAIFAANDAGISADDDAAYFSVALGQAYTLPLEEHFLADGGTQLLWGARSTGEIYLADETGSSDKDGYAFGLEADKGGEKAELYLAKLTPGQGNPTVLVDIKGDGSKQNVLRIVAETTDGQKYQLGAFVPTAEFKTYTVSLAELQNQKNITLLFCYDFNVAGTIVVDNVRIYDVLDNDLVASIEAPKSIKAGETANVAVKVANMSENSAKNYTVTLLADNKPVASETVAELLVPFAAKTVDMKYETSIFDDSKTVTLRAEVSYDADLNEDNNVAETVLDVKQSKLPKAENLTAENTADGVKLSWKAPSVISVETVEDFEDTSVFPLWSLGGVTAENHYGSFGDWTVYDGDGLEVYGWNADYNYEHKNEPHAWQVFDPVAAGISGWEPASGKQVLLSMCPEGVANDWLISPELPGIAQTITIKAGQISTVDPTSEYFYGYETFEVLVSQFGKSIATFDKIGEGVITAEGINEFTFELPAGTKYFAIRHTSNDIFGLYIDDIKFMSGGGAISKYNIYVDGKDGVYDDTAETTYTVKAADAAGAKWFAVSIVYDNGAESQPVVVNINGANQEISSIEQIANGKHAVDIYGIDGKLVRQSATTLKGLKGTYIIDGQKVTIK